MVTRVFQRALLNAEHDAKTKAVPKNQTQTQTHNFQLCYFSAQGGGKNKVKVGDDWWMLPDNGGQDCTHFAYTPFLYEPMWDQIANVMVGA
jgi:hypothetical protein